MRHSFGNVRTSVAPANPAKVQEGIVLQLVHGQPGCCRVRGGRQAATGGHGQPGNSIYIVLLTKEF